MLNLPEELRSKLINFKAIVLSFSVCTTSLFGFFIKLPNVLLAKVFI